MIICYGVEINGQYMDVSNSLLGAKQYATRNGFNEVYKRAGYNVLKVAEKKEGVWL